MMKKLTLAAVAILVLAVCAAARAQDAPLYKDVLEKLGSQDEAFRFPVSRWKAKNKMDERCLDPNYEPKGWKKSMTGDIWAHPGDRWFRSVFKMPDEIAGTPVKGSKVVFHATMQGYGHIYINGKHENYFRYDQGEALLTTNAVPGEEYIIIIRGINNQGTAVFADAYVSFSALDAVNQAANDYINKVRTVELFLEYADDQDKWLEVMNASAAAVDMDAWEKKDQPRLMASLEKAGAMLAPFKEIAKKYTMYLLGYSHIDLAWKWDYAEGEEVWKNTSETVFKLMDEYPDFIFTETQAHGYKWMQDDYPEVYEGLHKWYDTGRWEITGGTWSEHDSNVPSGEGFVRQFLYGKRWFMDNFDKDVLVAWTPDSFGYNWNLPQILAKSGMIGFLTQKINWNDTTKFPHHIFWWEGPDGTRMLTYFPVGGYGESVDAPRMIQQLKEIKKMHGLDENLVIFGIGDHGGGVTRTHLNRAFALKENGVYPEIKFTTAEDYFQRLLELSKTHDFPVYKDELYLQYHRGTYTSQANTKRNNRWGEILQETGEKFAGIATDYGYEYPYDRIFEGWYWILLNHMHDILPGSGIRKVYEDADRDYAKQQEILNGVLDESLAVIEQQIDTSKGGGTPLVIYNPLTWARDGVVEIPAADLPEAVVIMASNGSPVPTQLNQAGDKLVFVAPNVPALGYEVYRVLPVVPEADFADLTAQDNSIENEYFKVGYDPASGRITSLVDKESGREFLDGNGGNVLQLFNDNPDKYDAWNIKIGDQIYLDRAGDVEVVESGPVRVTIAHQKRAGISTFRHYVTLYRHVPLVVGRIHADWQERNVIAKLAFNLKLNSDTAWFEIPYAAIERAAVPRTREDQAKWEVSGQKWVNYSDADAGFGFTLLNDSKYGFDVKDNVLRMTLLRSPVSPDPIADRGEHDIRYAFYPHAGDWRDAAAPRRGHEFNTPLIARTAQAHEGKLPPRHSFFSCGPDNVILEVVKRAEDKDGVVLRMYEATGRDSEATITLPADVESVVETNLLEEKIADVSASGNTITVPVGHYEIKTLRVRFKQ